MGEAKTSTHLEGMAKGHGHHLTWPEAEEGRQGGTGGLPEGQASFHQFAMRVAWKGKGVPGRANTYKVQ